MSSELHSKLKLNKFNAVIYGNGKNVEQLAPLSPSTKTLKAM